MRSLPTLQLPRVRQCSELPMREDALGRSIWVGARAQADGKLGSGSGVLRAGGWAQPSTPQRASLSLTLALLMESSQEHGYWRQGTCPQQTRLTSLPMKGPKYKCQEPKGRPKLIQTSSRNNTALTSAPLDHGSHKLAPISLQKSPQSTRASTEERTLP